jgi:hypothetical protein
MLNKSKLILLAVFAVSLFLLYVFYSRPPKVLQPEPQVLIWPMPHDDDEAPLPKPNSDNYDQTLAELVEYRAAPEEPFFNAPCPISQSLQKDMVDRGHVIAFGADSNNRQWSGVTKRMEEKIPLDVFKKKIRDFIIVILKLQMPNNFHLFGASEAGDLMVFARHAICDEVAIAHHHIKGGIDPVIGQDYVEHAFDVSKQDRVLFEVMYRSCRMTASNAYRYTPGLFTRVSFHPTAADWNMILAALKIDAKRPNEVVCTYKSK